MLSQEPLEALGGLCEEDLFALAEETWQSLFAEPIFPGVPDRWVEWSDGGHLGAAVTITGQLDATILWDCPDALARRAAAHLFAVPMDEVDESMCADVMGELVNILGGLLKSATGAGGQLSLPLVGDDADALVLNHLEVAVVHLDTEEAPSVLRVYA